MSNGLNQRFKLNPVEFLSSYWDINSSQPQYGEGYGIDVNGIAHLDLRELAPETVEIKKAASGLLAFIGNEAPVRAYYLPAHFDQTTSLQLGRDADYFFTDTITGCQFMAYGNNRHNLTVCHVNALERGNCAYDAEAAEVRTANYPVQIIYGKRQYQGDLSPLDAPEVVVTVIGWRRADGWHFYQRRRVNRSNHRRVLGAAAQEL
ncbi:hypothetical protein FHW58_004887 [Duganella sp. 1224]|uniref:hypothetical protein n=1 Tax=Duganella sp. 1224 TaxID=2587052 RepID=UPI0015C6E84E|nr:hypothetical protein [Duganella sp. 1224]NYE63656.1 hypothetical protein [Duganella sp. 1224]